MLEVIDITCRFGSSQILNGVSFTLNRGEKTGIIGPNGSGKTTLFNCVSGFNNVHSGSIFFNENEITNTSPAKRARHGMARVFQNFGIFRDMTVMENIITAIETRQSPIFFPWSKRHKENKLQALEFLELVGIAGKANDKAGSLSGGQMRLLEITRALAFGAELFLLDEPTAGVSPKMKDDIMRALEQLMQRKKTILIIEHDMKFIHDLCDRIIVLDEGKVLLEGSPEEVRNDPRLKEIYFGSKDVA